MRDWPHSPLHRLAQAGTYMVTAGTYQKLPIFRSPPRLNFLCDILLTLAAQYGWQLQAWAVFPNHYHFVGITLASAESLRRLIRHFHSVTAKAANKRAAAPSRQVWFEYWDTQLTYEKSFLARLSYVHQNAVRHRLVRSPADYPWCSAGWFERRAHRSFFQTVMRFPCARVKVPDPYSVDAADIS